MSRSVGMSGDGYVRGVAYVQGLDTPYASSPGLNESRRNWLEMLTNYGDWWAYKWIYSYIKFFQIQCCIDTRTGLYILRIKSSSWVRSGPVSSSRRLRVAPWRRTGPGPSMTGSLIRRQHYRKGSFYCRNVSQPETIGRFSYTLHENYYMMCDVKFRIIPNLFFTSIQIRVSTWICVRQCK